MANKRITDLPQIGEIADTTKFYAGEQVKDYTCTGAQFKTYMGTQSLLDRLQTLEEQFHLAQEEQLGTIQTFSYGTLPENYLACDGSEVLKADYDKLYAKIGDTFGDTDLGYETPSDNTKFRVPNLLDQFIRNTDETRVLGTKQEDALQKITGQFNGMFVGDNTPGQGVPWGLDGAFYAGESVAAGNLSADNNSTWPTALFDSSRVVRTDTETRPKNTTLIFGIKAK